MKTLKVIHVAAAIAVASIQLPAIASGNAHKYPVVPKEVPAEPVVAAPAVSPAAAAPVAKPVEASAPKASTAVSAPPVATPAAPVAAVAKPAEPPAPSLSERLSGKIVIVSRYEPLSGRDSLEAVPDLNRGRGKGK